MSDQSAQPPEEETTILVGGMTGEEFLGLPERVDFVPAPTTDQQAFLDATRERGRVTKPSRVRSATEEEIAVRPPDYSRPPPTEQPDAEEDQSTNS